MIVPFPFSDLTQTKKRPAFVIASLEGDDVILCQITSQSVRDQHAISINDGDFEKGSLKQSSNIRLNRLFAADNHIILYRVGNLRKREVDGVISAVVGIVKK
jgi:mRNA interferase MazF